MYEGYRQSKVHEFCWVVLGCEKTYCGISCVFSTALPTLAMLVGNVGFGAVVLYFFSFSTRTALSTTAYNNYCGPVIPSLSTFPVGKNPEETHDLGQSVTLAQKSILNEYIMNGLTNCTTLPRFNQLD